MNETLFFLHLLLIFGFGILALKCGKVYLIVWIALQATLANLFVVKQISLFGFNTTCSDMFAIGSILGINLLQEYFDKQTAQRALWATFFGMLFFAAMSQIHLLYTPNAYDRAQAAFALLLTPSPRLFIASIAVFLLVQQLDVRVFGLLKAKAFFLPFWVRNALSIACTQWVDTCLFSFLGLWGIVESLFDVILISFLIKLLIIAALSPLLVLMKRFVPIHTQFKEQL